ncbi:MAG: hypothetical protein HC780_04515 [Leptolyngbyaceae cyanobacterium CSU_1_3]|nr:hypothetical protein [Leptolyngbyaceae cyanobacterium CSU_1_3]
MSISTPLNGSDQSFRLHTLPSFFTRNKLPTGGDRAVALRLSAVHKFLGAIAQTNSQ